MALYFSCGKPFRVRPSLFSYDRFPRSLGLSFLNPDTDSPPVVCPPCELDDACVRVVLLGRDEEPGQARQTAGSCASNDAACEAHDKCYGDEHMRLGPLQLLVHALMLPFPRTESDFARPRLPLLHIHRPARNHYSGPRFHCHRLSGTQDGYRGDLLLTALPCVSRIEL